MAATVDVSAAPEIGVGLIGYAFMGKTPHHLVAYKFGRVIRIS